MTPSFRIDDGIESNRPSNYRSVSLNFVILSCQSVNVITESHRISKIRETNPIQRHPKVKNSTLFTAQNKQR